MFEKGKSGNPSGRPKGCLNKSSGEIREVLSMIAVNNLKKVQVMLDKCTNPDKFLTQYFTLMRFILPTLQKAEIEGDIDSKVQIVVTYESEDNINSLN